MITIQLNMQKLETFWIMKCQENYDFNFVKRIDVISNNG